jgi:hypothetical protein
MQSFIDELTTNIASEPFSGPFLLDPVSSAYMVGLRQNIM